MNPLDFRFNGTSDVERAVESDLRALEVQRRERIRRNRRYGLIGLIWAVSVLFGAVCVAASINANIVALAIGFGAAVPLTAVTIVNIVRYFADYA